MSKKPERITIITADKNYASQEKWSMDVYKNLVGDTIKGQVSKFFNIVLSIKIEKEQGLAFKFFCTTLAHDMYLIYDAIAKTSFFIKADNKDHLLYLLSGVNV